MSRFLSLRMAAPRWARPAAALLSTGALLAGSLGACVQILGNDFVITADDDGAGGSGAGGSGAAGGAGGDGGGGGQGGVDVPSYACDWLLDQHIELTRLEGGTQSFGNALLAQRRDEQSARVIVVRKGGSNEDTALVFTMGDGNPTANTFSATRVHQLERSSIQTLGLLYNRLDGTTPLLRLRQISDSSGGNDDLVAVISNNTFPGLSGNELHARFAMVSSSPGNPVIDILAWWPTTGGSYRLGYARYAGSSLSFQTIASFDNVNDAAVTAMVHHEGTTYGWIGADSALGTRLVQIDAQNSVPPTPVGLIDTSLLSYGSSATETRFVALRFTTPVQLLAGAIPNHALSTFDPTTDLNLVGTWDSVGQVPVWFGRPRWHGDLHAYIGTPFQPNNPSAELRYWFIGSDGVERALETMPFTATLPAGEIRNGPVIGTSVEASDDFDTQGGMLHVFWTEDHTSSADPTFSVLYYDRLVCSAG